MLRQITKQGCVGTFCTTRSNTRGIRVTAATSSLAPFYDRLRMMQFTFCLPPSNTMAAAIAVFRRGINRFSSRTSMCAASVVLALWSQKLGKDLTA